jgi:hypothetical protein
MKNLVRAVGVLCCMMAVLGALVFASAVEQKLTAQGESAFRFSGKARWLESMPALAMEFVEDEGEVGTYLGARDATGDSEMRGKLRAALAADNVFIAFYWLLFIGLCALLAQRKWKFALWLAVFAAVCATGAAISDTVENAHTATLLDAPTITKALVRNVATASSEKWLLIALATLALAPTFRWKADARGRRVGGALLLLYLAVGALILVGVLGALPLLVAVGFVLNFLGVAAVAFFFTRRTEWVASQL